MEWDERTARVFGEEVRSLRRASKLSQEELGRCVGISKNQIQLIEAGRQSGREAGRPSNPRASTLLGIAKALGLPISQLFRLVEEATQGK